MDASQNRPLPGGTTPAPLMPPNLKSAIPVACLSLLIGGFSSAAAQPSLKDAFKDHFLIGAALDKSQFGEKNAALIKAQFNSITPENVMKWEKIHPQPGVYEFALADRFVDFGVRNGMFVIGHTLVWHQQTPDWVFENPDGTPLGRDALLERMRDHIHTVVGRYKGRIKGWDVVNEALEENGALRGSRWRSIIGDDFIQKAFEYAHEADPLAELYYNDFSLENAAKREGAVQLVHRLKQAGVSIHGVGIQEHVNLRWPALTELENTITALGRSGVKVMITELDVDMLSGKDNSGNADISRRETAGPETLPGSKTLSDELQQKLAGRYRDLFGVYLKHRDVVSRVTFWGVCDGDSWLNNCPIPGRANHPLLFDRESRPKPALEAVIEAARAASGK